MKDAGWAAEQEVRLLAPRGVSSRPAQHSQQIDKAVPTGMRFPELQSGAQSVAHADDPYIPPRNGRGTIEPERNKLSRYPVYKSGCRELLENSFRDCDAIAAIRSDWFTQWSRWSAACERRSYLFRPRTVAPEFPREPPGN
jgi:hypothetical protein